MCNALCNNPLSTQYVWSRHWGLWCILHIFPHSIAYKPHPFSFSSTGKLALEARNVVRASWDPSSARWRHSTFRGRRRPLRRASRCPWRTRRRTTPRHSCSPSGNPSWHNGRRMYILSHVQSLVFALPEECSYHACLSNRETTNFWTLVEQTHQPQDNVEWKRA